MKNVFLAFMLLAISSCSYKSSQEDLLKHADALSHDVFTLQGDYHWDFTLMGGTQHSTHTFYADSITYNMEGKVYATEYTMHKLSYDKAVNKWIGLDADSIVYVLFFKEKTDSTIMMYKHKCKDGGLEEAINFAFPAPDATDDHGWNVYALHSDLTRDILPVSGTFVHKSDELHLSDKVITLNGRTFDKLSYHAGERRWMGQADSLYLQVFIEQFENPDTLTLAVAQHTDLEFAYKVKYQAVTFDSYHRP